MAISRRNLLLLGIGLLCDPAQGREGGLQAVVERQRAGKAYGAGIKHPAGTGGMPNQDILIDGLCYDETGAVCTRIVLGEKPKVVLYTADWILRASIEERQTMLNEAQYLQGFLPMSKGRFSDAVLTDASPVGGVRYAQPPERARELESALADLLLRHYELIDERAIEAGPYVYVQDLQVGARLRVRDAYDQVLKAKKKQERAAKTEYERVLGAHSKVGEYVKALQNVELAKVDLFASLQREPTRTARIAK